MAKNKKPSRKKGGHPNGFNSKNSVPFPPKVKRKIILLDWFPWVTFFILFVLISMIYKEVFPTQKSLSNDLIILRRNGSEFEAIISLISIGLARLLRTYLANWLLRHEYNQKYYQRLIKEYNSKLWGSEQSVSWFAIGLGLFFLYFKINFYIKLKPEAIEYQSTLFSFEKKEIPLREIIEVTSKEVYNNDEDFIGMKYSIVTKEDTFTLPFFTSLEPYIPKLVNKLERLER